MYLYYHSNCIVDPAIWVAGRITEEFSREGNKTTLTFDVCMGPWGQFSWTLEGDTVPGNITEVDNTLTINYVTQEHFGEYTCTAENNILGSEYIANFNIYLAQRGPPGDPTNLTVEASTSVSVTLGWTCGHNGGDDNMWFELYISQAGVEFEVYDDNIPADCITGERNRPDYRVEGLESGTKYDFKVMVGNEYDLGASHAIPTNISHTTVCKWLHIIIYMV